jgi:UDP-3-O-[3-hydroxymyristoyl] glucosamine N-acyltransferase
MRHTLGEIAEVIGAELHGDPALAVSGVATLSNARPDQLSFLGNPRWARHLKDTRAAAVIVRAPDLGACPVNALVADDPYVAYVKAARLLHPEPVPSPGVDERAAVQGSARVSRTAAVGPCAVIGERSVLEDRAFVGPGCVIGDDVVIGKDTRLVANVTICRGVKLGERVLVHPGVVIGADGFGLASDAGRWLKIPQLGGVVIHDDVEIGANAAIDRGALDDTVVEEGVKIDNLVQIGHNVRIGAHTAIAGCAVIAGSVTIGKRCMIGGAAALAGHIEIADDVIITGQSGVPNSIRQAGTYSGGIAAVENRTWLRNMVRFRNLDEMARKIRDLEVRVEELTGKGGSGT